MKKGLPWWYIVRWPVLRFAWGQILWWWVWPWEWRVRWNEPWPKHGEYTVFRWWLIGPLEIRKWEAR